MKPSCGATYSLTASRAINCDSSRSIVVVVNLEFQNTKKGAEQNIQLDTRTRNVYGVRHSFILTDQTSCVSIINFLLAGLAATIIVVIAVSVGLCVAAIGILTLRR
jgi:hypothetical protein